MTVDELVRVAGVRAEEHAALGARTTYRVGGTARVLVTLSTPRDVDELGPAIFSTGLDVVVVGNGSNLLVADGPQELVAVRLSGEFAELSWSGGDRSVRVHAGAGLDLPVAARRLAGEGIVGFEWAVGVPGSVGGAVVMNAGGHGSDMAASVIEVESFSSLGKRTWRPEELAFTYRSSSIGPGDVVTNVTLELARGDANEAKERLREIVRWRREHQPGGANAGSVFRNPPGDSAGRLIELAGCKGLRLGSAVVSDKHANFIIADAGGRASDVFALIGAVRERVASATGVVLVAENHFIGFKGRS